MRKTLKNFRVDYSMRPTPMIKFSAKSVLKNFSLKNWSSIGPTGLDN
jgi:hypothetical protein